MTAMDIRVLYTIVAIAEHGSFLAASRALNLSPAAVSLHVKIIEDELGETLFDRSVRPPVATDAGRRTLERARRVLAEWEKLGENGAGEAAGMLALGAVPTAVAGLLAPALARLRALRPQLRVTLTTDDAEELEDRLGRGMVDAALTIQPSSPPLGLRFTPVLVEPFHVVAPAGTPGDTDAELLTALPYIRFRGHAWIAHLIEQELSRRRLRLDAAMESDSLTGVLALVRAELGVAILPAGQIDDHHAVTLRTVPFGDPPVSRTIGLLRRPDHVKTPQIEEFVAALQATVAGAPPEEAGARSAQKGENQGLDERGGDGETNEIAQVDPEHETTGGNLEQT
ncbi:MAG: LysR family transcriptional regulator [Alphaproteobacteria bacterium]|nr:LysR family transcriptional regulator [Alphaproteobacteria bacterium]